MLTAVLFAVAAVCLASGASSLSVESTTLKLVQVITRHGARTPYAELPEPARAEWDCTLRHLSIPSNYDHEYFSVGRLYRKNYIKGREILPGNCMQGQLTEAGYKLHYSLGEQFRRHYVDDLHFLEKGGYPSAEHIYVRSTDVPRTVASAEAQLLGFFPRNPESAPAQLVNIDVVEHAREDMSPGNKCPKMIQQCNAVQNTSTWRTWQKSADALLAKLASEWNTSVSEMPSLDSLWDNIYARSWHNISMPTGITKPVFDDVKSSAAWTIETAYDYQDVARLGIGVFLGEVMSRFEASIKHQSQLKWVYYSGHDTTCALFLSAFGALRGRGWPPYAAHIVMELRADTAGKNYVRFLYQDEVVKLPGCNGEELCPYDEFAKIAGQSVITQAQWEQECKVSSPPTPVGFASKFLC
jgi:Histidine phosphatase superfamily (branch 2)